MNIAQGTGNAGKVLGVNSSGNVTPITISTGKNTIFTGDITELIRYSKSTITISQDFDIEYIYYTGAEYWTNRTSIYAGTYKTTSYAYFGVCSGFYGSTNGNNISVSSSEIGVKVYYNNTARSIIQLKNKNMPSSSSAYFRIYI